MIQTRTLYISYNHLIETRRDHADFRFFQSRIQKLTIFFHRNRFLTEQFGKLVE